MRNYLTVAHPMMCGLHRVRKGDADVEFGVVMTTNQAIWAPDGNPNLYADPINDD